MHGPMIHGNHSNYLNKKGDGYQGGEAPRSNHKRVVSRGKDPGSVNIRTGNWPNAADSGAMEGGAHLTPLNSAKRRLQTNSAVRLRNNYSDVNLSNGGGSVPEEYRPSGRSSEKKGMA